MEKEELLIKKATKIIVDMCENSDTALSALANWVEYESVEEEAIQAIHQRILMDMDAQSAYYLMRIMQAMKEEDRPIEIDQLMSLVLDFGDDDMQESMLTVANQPMLEKIKQESRA